MTDPMGNWVPQLVSHMAQEQAEAMDAYILKFFGSMENVEKYGHLYELVVHPDEVIVTGDGMLRMTSTYRLEPKPLTPTPPPRGMNNG